MGYLGEIELGPSFQPFAALRAQFGMVPHLFRSQTLVPGIIEAEVTLLSVILFHERALSRLQKEFLLLMLASAQRNEAWIAIHYQMLRLLAVPESRLDQIMAGYKEANLSRANAALITFALKLGVNGEAILQEDITGALAEGLTEESLLEAILVTALANFLATLSIGLGVPRDFARRQFPQVEVTRIQATGQHPKPFWGDSTRSPDDFEPFDWLQGQFGLVPEVFRAQMLRPDVVEAEVQLMRTVLTGLQPGKLFDFGAKLAEQPTEFSREDIDFLRSQEFSDQQILEAVVTTALSRFLTTIECGMGAGPDFPLRRNFQSLEPKKVHLSGPDTRHTVTSSFVDPDADWVARVQGGDLNAFEELMNRHSQRVYRTLIGLLGNPEDARDAMQDTFLKAFQHLGGFEGRSKFSTWMVSIASNTAIQRLRERKPIESLDDDFESEEGFRPRQVQAWTDDPEQLYSQTEMRSLIESSVMKLPAKYRVVLMLRDIDQLPVEDAAAALSLSLPAFKARLLRGRLMLREALAPHFAARPGFSAKGVS